MPPCSGAGRYLTTLLRITLPPTTLFLLKGVGLLEALVLAYCVRRQPNLEDQITYPAMQGCIAWVTARFTKMAINKSIIKNKIVSEGIMGEIRHFLLLTSILPLGAGIA